MKVLAEPLKWNTADERGTKHTLTVQRLLLPLVLSLQRLLLLLALAAAAATVIGTTAATADTATNMGTTHRCYNCYDSYCLRPVLPRCYCY